MIESFEVFKRGSDSCVHSADLNSTRLNYFFGSSSSLCEPLMQQFQLRVTRVWLATSPARKRENTDIVRYKDGGELTILTGVERISDALEMPLLDNRSY